MTAPVRSSLEKKSLHMMHGPGGGTVFDGGDDLIRPLRLMSKDPKMHFFYQNARQRYNDLKALVEGMIKLIEDTGSVESVSDESAQHKRLLFKQGFQLMEKFINKHHPVHKNKKFKDTIACRSPTTLRVQEHDQYVRSIVHPSSS